MKNVNEKVDAGLLKQALTRFGKLKYFDVNRPKVRFPILYQLIPLSFRSMSNLLLFRTLPLLSSLSLPATLLPLLPTPTRLALSRLSLRSVVLAPTPSVTATLLVVAAVAVMAVVVARVVAVSSVMAVVASLPAVVVVEMRLPSPATVPLLLKLGFTIHT